MNGVHILRIIIHSIATIGLLIGVILISISIVKPNWQEAQFNDLGHGEYHYHGLWEDCIVSLQSIDKHMLCTYKDYSKKDRERLDEMDFDRMPRNMRFENQMQRDMITDHHKGEKWRFTTLITLSCCCGFAWISIILALVLSCGWCMCKGKAVACKAVAVSWLIVQLLAFFCGAAGLGHFARMSFDVKNRIVTGVTDHVEQHWGRSFYLCLFGLVSLGASFLVSLVAVILHFVASNKSYTYVRVHKDMVERMHTSDRL